MISNATVDSRLFRRVMGRFPSGVTIVTTPGEEGGGQVHGMTANGFLSVSLDPPLVLVSLARSSRMAGLIPRTGRYGVSILANDQEAYSRHFAGRPEPDLQPDFAWHDGIPLLGGALAQIGCEVWDEHDAGDHVLFIGRVRHLFHDQGEPLVFFTGAYRALHNAPHEDFFTH